MDQTELVKNINGALTKIEDKNAPINFALLLFDDRNYLKPNRQFTLMMGAEWLNKRSPFSATKEIIEDFYSFLPKEILKRISRINLVSTMDPSVQQIYSGISVRGGYITLEKVTIFNVYIEYGILFRSFRG
jgi:hypothetical protein